LLEDDTFLVINGKIITDIDLSLAIKHHRATNALATMVLLPNLRREHFTVVNTKDGRVTGFGGFPAGESDEVGPPLMFTGIQILEPAVFDYIPRGVYSDIVPSFYNPAIADGKRISAYVADGTWYEISTIERYLEVSLAMIWPSTCFTGEGCKIADTADVESTVLWDNVTIGEGSRIRRAVIADGVNVPPRSEYRDVAIVRAEMLKRAAEIPEKAPKGYFDGENYIVPLNFA
jgi:NDP-sugar pyrophosphorylase family protein